MNYPLSGLRVLDLTIARAGPTAVRHLADWGAEVIRIQAPVSLRGKDENLGEGHDYENLHRSKRCMSLNLKHAEGRDLFYKMVAGADVVVENMRPDVKFSLGVDYDTLAAINPGIVYGSISGFGQSGPYRNDGGVDQIAQGLSGLMSITGFPGQGPVRTGLAIADMAAGNSLALAISMALFERTKTGKGRWVHTSLLEALIHMMDFQASRWLMDKEVAFQVGNDHPTAAPTGTFPTADGHINMAASSTRFFERLCAIFGDRALFEEPDYRTFKSRADHRVELNKRVSAHTSRFTSVDLIATLKEKGIPCGPIYTVDQTFADPQVKSIGMAITNPAEPDREYVASSLNFEGLERRIFSAAPAIDEHTNDILKEFGISHEDASRLRDNGVI